MCGQGGEGGGGGGRDETQDRIEEGGGVEVHVPGLLINHLSDPPSCSGLLPTPSFPFPT